MLFLLDIDWEKRNLFEKWAIYDTITMEDVFVRQVRVLSENGSRNISNVQGERMEVMKRTIKDSVFTDLFQDKKYLLQLYKALHPEDNEVTEDKLTDITIKNVLTDNIYNDLGFMVGGRLMILAEAQSTWTMNIIIRGLMYMVQTWHDYFSRTKQNLYKSKKVNLPKPELYVIFTGERKTKPTEISLSEEFFGGEDCCIDVRVKMIYDGREGDIINQYVIFTKICNEQIRLHGRTREAIAEAIRICKDRNILKEYLSKKESEVIDIMMVLYDEEEIMRSYVESERYDEKIETAKRFLQMKKFSYADIAVGSGLTVGEVEELANDLQLA